MTLELNQIYNMDCVEGMKMMDDNSVDLTVTSPPYDNLRKYNGYSFDFESVANELYRVTKDGGVVVWIVGDETKDFCESMTSFKQAIHFRKIGFKLLDTMIYLKQNVPPAYPSIRRYGNQFEFMFVLVKGKKPNVFNPVMVEKTNKEYAWKCGFRQKNGDFVEKVIDQKNDKKKATNVWAYALGEHASKDKIAFKHPAIFPEKLAEDHILSWSNPKEIVFDPFAGSGTTLKMAKLNNRNYIGMEISSEYIDIANERIKQTSDVG